MDKIEQLRRAILPFHKYARWIFLFTLTVWTISVGIRLYTGNTDWGISLMILGLILAAWVFHLSVDYEKHK